MNKSHAIVMLAVLVFASACYPVNLDNLESIEPLSADMLSEIEIADHSAADELTFLVLGDMGEGDRNQYAVGEAMGDYCALNRCDFVLGLGDNIYRDGVRSEDARKFKTRFERPYEDLGRIDFWMVPGNHDWHLANSVQSEINYSAESERWRMPGLSYAVPNLPEWVSIYAVDTTVAAFSVWWDGHSIVEAVTDDMLEDANTALCDKPGWRLMFGHHPRYSSGKHAVGEDPAGKMISIDETIGAVADGCGVQVYFSGHDHHQELIWQDDFVQVIQGAGGRYLRELPQSDKLAGARWSSVQFGFGVIKLTPAEMNIRFYGLEENNRFILLCSWVLSNEGTIESQSAECDLS